VPESRDQGIGRNAFATKRIVAVFMAEFDWHAHRFGAVSSRLGDAVLNGVYE